MILVTKPYLPNRDKLDRYIDGIYERNWLTNNGPLVQELTRRLEDYLGVENLLLVANGTLALQVAYRVLGIGNTQDAPDEVITTPFSFVATASSLKWEGLKPVFADIDSESWCIDPDEVEASITPRTSAVVPVHVFGNACDVERIDAIAERYGLKVIYDGAHAFGVDYKNESLLKRGDAATLSFHATKLFHSIEGGAIIFKEKSALKAARSMINFGISESGSIDGLGVNAKMNEFQAAMGLCVLDEIEENISARSAVYHAYLKSLEVFGQVKLQRRAIHSTNNFSYFPVLLDSEADVKKAINNLAAKGVAARRYFYPSLDSLPFLEAQTGKEKSRDISERVLCLPLHAEMDPSVCPEIIKEIYGV